MDGIPHLLSGQSVVNVFAGPAIFHHSRTLQLSEVARNTGLSHAEYFLELGDGELFLFEKKEETKPGGIGKETEKING